MRWIFALFVSLASATAIAPRQTPTSFPMPEPCSGDGCHGNGYGDASVIIVGGTYYRFSKNNNTGSGIQMATAPSLRGPWGFTKSILTGPIKDPVAGSDPQGTNLWAPEIHFINGVFYLYYGVERPQPTDDGGFDIAVANATNIEGPWTDLGSIGIPSLPKGKPAGSGGRIWTKLGASLLVNASDPSGGATDPHFLGFGSYNTGLYGILMKGPPKAVHKGAFPTLLIADQPLPLVDGNTRKNRTEGPYLYKRDNSHYFVFYSVGDTAPAVDANPALVYRMKYCRAAQATGPYFDKLGRNCSDSQNLVPYGSDGSKQPGTILLETHSNKAVFAPGSMGILNDPTEGLVMYYQYFNASDGNKHGGHRFGFNFLEFDSDGWPSLVANRSST